MQIKSLECDEQILDDPIILKEHITEYYKQLFGKVDLADMHLEHDMWPIA